jgi:hypothetical protein
MPTFLTVFADPAKATMLLICVVGVGFMIWFLVGLFTDLTKVRTKYVVRFKLGDQRSSAAFASQLSDEAFVEGARLDAASFHQLDRVSHVPVQVRIQQRF